MIAKVFKINDERVTIHLENPTKEDFIFYCKNLENWSNMFVSLDNGEVYSMRKYLLSLID